MNVMIDRFLARLAPLLLVVGLATASPTAAHSQDIGGDSVLLRSIETYLDSFRTMRARFVQYSQDGARAEGMLWLKRPGRFRFEYAPPDDILLVGDGTWLIFYDAAVNQVSHLPLDSGAPRFLTAEEIRFGGDVGVTAVERGESLIRVTVVDRRNPGSGSLILGFEEEPMVLREWTVIDPQGRATRVILDQIEHGVELNNRFFYFTDNHRVRDFRRGSYP